MIRHSTKVKKIKIRFSGCLFHAAIAKKIQIAGGLVEARGFSPGAMKIIQFRKIFLHLDLFHLAAICTGWFAIVVWVGRGTGLVAKAIFLEFDGLPILYRDQPTIFRVASPLRPRPRGGSGNSGLDSGSLGGWIEARELSPRRPLLVSTAFQSCTETNPPLFESLRPLSARDAVAARETAGWTRDRWVGGSRPGNCRQGNFSWFRRPYNLVPNPTHHFSCRFAPFLPETPWRLGKQRAGLGIVGWVGRGPGLVAKATSLGFDGLPILYRDQPTIFRVASPLRPRPRGGSGNSGLDSGS